MRRSISAVLIGFGLIAIATPASADPAEIRIAVTQADLDSQTAVSNLYQRVNDAAASVCVEVMRGGNPIYRTRAACKREVVDAALRATPIAPLARLHAEVRSRPQDATTLASR